MKEPLPLARIQEAVLEFLRNRDDAVLFGAQAVNAYVDEPRMTQDVDVLSTRAMELSEELRAHLAKEFGIAVRVRQVAGGRGFRVFQLRQPRNRRLVKLRHMSELPPTRVIADIRVPTPEVLIAQKVISAARRRSQPKGDTDRRDLKELLLTCPELKTESGPVMERLKAENADAAAIAEWKKLVHKEIAAQDDDDGEFGDEAGG